MRKSLVLLATCCLANIFCYSPAVAADPTAVPTFQDRTQELGLQLANSKACWIDVDNDNFPDLCAGGVLWKNNQGNSFTKLAEGLGEVVAADFDNDGFADLLSTTTIRVHRNRSGTAFEPLDIPDLPATISLAACWADVNGDGYLDAYIGGFENWEAGITYPDLLLVNQQGKSLSVAFHDARFRARGVTACDFDQDGDADIYVSNYRLQPNLLWLNDGHAQLTDAAADYNAVGTSPGFDGGHSIGACWGDFDNDGLFDLFVGNFAHVDDRGDQPKSRFLQNLGPSQHYKFADRGPCGVFYQESYASPSAADFDNDGNLDLFFTTVYAVASFDIKNNPVLFHNDGNLTFSNATSQTHLAELPPTYQAAWADFDRDGDVDLAAAGKLWANAGSAQHWIELRLEGDGTSVSRSAVGTQVRLAVAGGVMTRQVEAGTGEGNQNDLVLHFGLGKHDALIRATILWPNGQTQLVENLAVDRLHQVKFAPE